MEMDDTIIQVKPTIVSTSDNAITYAFSKNNGVFFSDIKNNYAHIFHLAWCSPYALLELRRSLDLPLILEEVDEEHFINLLTNNYQSKATGSFQIAEDLGEDINLQQMIDHLPKISDLLEIENDAPVIRLINALLREAINQSASDIHFEPFKNLLIVRLRVDGILHNALEVPSKMSALVVSRLKNVYPKMVVLP
jgi:general secretion pathway protein E